MGSTSTSNITYSIKTGDTYVPLTTSSTSFTTAIPAGIWKDITTVSSKYFPPCANIPYSLKIPGIKKVIFNNPATIIIWEDNTKTVVKLMDGDCWDPEKGFIMAYMKKLLGVEKLRKDIKKWVKPQEKKEEEEALISFKVEDGIELLDSIKDTLARIFNKTEDK